jgi:hypothetical protein
MAGAFQPASTTLKRTARLCERGRMVTGNTPAPIGGRQGRGKPKKSTRPLGNVPPIDTSAPEYLDFMERVLAAAIADRIRKGRTQFSDIASDGLGPIENGKVMRKEAATECIQLLKDARAALAENAEKYGFHPLESEEWHCDFR